MTAVPRPAPAPAANIWFAAIVVLALWTEVASRLRFEWSVNPQYGYGWAVPFAALYLLWRRYNSRPDPQPTRSRGLIVVGALLLALILLPTRLISEANPDWRLLSWSMSLAAVGVSLAIAYLMGGASWLRHFAFPFCFFLIAVPWPTQFEQFVIQGLMRMDAAFNVELLNMVGITALQRGNVIEIATGLVGIDEACTGVRSLQATLMVSLFFGEFYGFSALRRFVLVIAGAVLAFVCNLVRTFILVWVGAERGIDAIKSWHDPAGFTILIVCLVGLWLTSLWFRRGANTPDAPPSTSPVPASPRFLLSALLVILVCAEAGTQFWYLSRERHLPRSSAWTIAWPTDASGYKEVPIAESAQDLLRYNDGGGATWTGRDGHAWNLYFFRWLPGRTAGLFVKNHRPDICLPASGLTQRGAADYSIVDVNGIPLPMRSYTFDAGGTPLHVFYCYWDGSLPDPKTINEENWTARGRLKAVERGKRDIGTQMLELIVAGYADKTRATEAARAQLSALVHRN
ncbi:MAG: exosortase/archaeosortase family protein [Verrucomicrobiota bacterium]|nr:exosortase/archaeosortase family protein [Verrucomicrobiota bacterium]